MFRYLREEALEVQVWATVFGKRSTVSRPRAEDSLVGTAHVPLSHLLRGSSTNEHGLR